MNRTRAIVVLHVLLFSAAYVLAFLARFEFDLPRNWLVLCLWTLPIVVAIQTVTAACFSLFRGWWRYVSLRDMMSVATAVSLSGLLLFTARGTVEDFSVPRGVILIDWAFALLLLAAARASVRLAREGLLGVRRGYPWARRKSAVIVLGAGDSAEMLLRDLFALPDTDLEVVGLLDDDPGKHGHQIHRVPILGPCNIVKQIADRTGAKLALLAMPSATGKQRRRVLELVRAAGLECKTLPSLAQLADGRVSVSQVRPVEIEDLLGRDPVQTNLAAIRAKIRGRTVLITGASGSIGSELCRQIAGFEPQELVLFDRNETGLFWLERELREAHPATADRFVVALGDITDEERLRELLEQHRPAMVFHAAAYKHVPLVESSPAEAVKNNVLGTMVVADAAEEAAVETFVLVSTDKAVNPCSIMGATKRLAELYLLSLSRAGARTRFVSVRFGNVLGSVGSVVPIFERQIREGGPVTVTHAGMKRFFMTTSEAVQLILQAAEFGRGGEIFVLDMGEPVRIIDLAYDMIRLSGLKPGEDIEVVVTGVRPGEKLEEELYAQDEKALPTAHSRIRVLRNPALAGRLDACFRNLTEEQRAKIASLCAASNGRGAAPARKEFGAELARVSADMAVAR